MRIGIFGGTFDPPHIGHRKYACEFIDRLALDKLIVIPTCIPPHKEYDGVSGSDRLAMTKLLFTDIDKIDVSDMEIRRKGKSYTCDTVRALSEKYFGDELIFLMGSDMLLSFHTWREPLTILKYVKICAVSRESNITKEQLSEYVDRYFKEKADRFIICDFLPVEVSSTDVRISMENNQSSKFITAEVLNYIKEKGLYA